MAPMISPKSGLPFHEWWVEFDEDVSELDVFSNKLDRYMRERNIYYNDLVAGKILKNLEIRKVKKGGFNQYMKSLGRFGGQNKIPKLSNDRNYVEGLKKFAK